MNRRKFLKGMLAGGAVVGAGGSIAWLSVEGSEEPLTIARTLEKLDSLHKGMAVTKGKWNLFQVFTHCAESVEYSMTGYPEHKSQVFKTTVGKGAFKVFKSKGKMRHNLSEAIPGAPAFPEVENLTEAYNRFRQSLIDFQNFKQTLKPHFAYGELSKEDYAIAHAMHFNNHLQEISVL